MPSLETFGTTKPIKGLYLGDAGAGKTGSLASLASKFKLRIWDYDNNLEPLFQHIGKDYPGCEKNVTYQTFTDELALPDQPMGFFGDSAQAIPFYKGTPKAFATGLKAFNTWEDGSAPQTWDKSHIIVVDTLTTLAQAAFRYCWALDPACKDKRNVYRNAQNMVLNTVQLLCSEAIKCNVLLLAHVDYNEDQFKQTKGVPRSIGAALGPQVPSYFNSVFLAQTVGSGNTLSRVIRTVSTGVVDLKNPVSFKVKDNLPLKTGLLEFFTAVRP